MHHKLKIHPQHLERVIAGTKTFEIRKNDRVFQKGDLITLHEYDPTLVDKDGPSPNAIALHSLSPRTHLAEKGYTGKEHGPLKIGDVYPIDAERVVFSLMRAHSED